MCRAVILSRHSSEPVVNERKLTDTSPRNNCNDIYLLVCPCLIQESDIFLSTKQIAPCYGQSCYGNFLWSPSRSRCASSEAQMGNGRLLEALGRDSTPRIDRACYYRYHFQKLGRSLKTPPGILLKSTSSRTTTGCGDTLTEFVRAVTVRADEDTSPQQVSP